MQHIYFENWHSICYYLKNAKVGALFEQQEILIGIKSFKIFSTIALDLRRWGCIRAGLVLFQNQILTGVVLAFEEGEVLFRSGVAFKRIR